jgi:hypothetical protein
MIAKKMIWVLALMFGVFFSINDFGNKAEAAACFCPGQKIRIWLQKGNSRTYHMATIVAVYIGKIRVRVGHNEYWINPTDVGSTSGGIDSTSSASGFRPGQRVRFWIYVNQKRTYFIGYIVIIQSSKIQIRFKQSGYSGYRILWIDASNVTIYSGGGSTVTTTTCNGTIFKARNGKEWCCPPGTTGYYQGQTGIVCRQKTVVSGGGGHGSGGSGSSCGGGMIFYKGNCCPKESTEDQAGWGLHRGQWINCASQGMVRYQDEYTYYGKHTCFKWRCKAGGTPPPSGSANNSCPGDLYWYGKGGYCCPKSWITSGKCPGSRHRWTCTDTRNYNGKQCPYCYCKWAG